MKYAITPALTLTATVNPDFGQVEADPAVVNLSAFETFFPERRPFFVEGSGVFRFDMDCNDGSCTGLFYTRRIGRQPQLSADVPDDGFVSAPSNTTIIGATKATGRIGGFSVGILNALTAEEEARVAVGSAQSTSPIEPFASYTVGRARREFANQSAIGVMMTATNRNVGDERSPMRLLGQFRLRGRRRLGLAARAQALRPRRLLGRHAHQRHRGGHRAAAGEQRPQLPASRRDARRVRSDADHARRPVRLAGLPQDLRRAGAVRVEHVLQDAGLRQQRSRVHPARRPDHAEQLAAVAARPAGQVHPQLPLQPQPVGRPQLRRRPPVLRRQRQRALDVQEQLEHRLRDQPRARQLRRPRDARRAGRQLRGQLELLELRQHRRSQGRRFRHVSRRRLVGVRAALLRRQPRSHLPPDRRRSR